MFTCTFVEGSQSLGCSIEYLCTRTEYNGQLNIKRHLGSQNVTKCIDGIYVCDYNMYIYDIEQPVYQLIQYNIDGLFPSTMSASLISSPSQIDTRNSVPTVSESLNNHICSYSDWWHHYTSFSIKKIRSSSPVYKEPG